MKPMDAPGGTLIIKLFFGRSPGPVKDGFRVKVVVPIWVVVVREDVVV